MKRFLTLTLLFTASVSFVLAQEGNLSIIPPVDQIEPEVGLLKDAMDSAMTNLEEGKWGEFVDSYRTMVTAFGRLSDHVGNASETLGEVGVRLEMVSSSLNNLESPEHNPEQRDMLAKEVGSLREQLAARLSSLKAEYEQASPEARKELIEQMSAIVRKIEQLDQLRKSVDEGDALMLPSTANKQLANQVKEMAQAVEDERQALKMTASSLRYLVSTSVQQMQQSLEFVALKSSLPSNQLQMLKQSRHRIQTQLDELSRSRKRTSEAILNMLVGDVAGEDAIAEDDLLRRVDLALEVSAP